MATVTIINANVSELHQVPLGALLIVAVLEEAGHKVAFMDYQTYAAKRKPAVDTFYRFLQGADGGLVGISVMCNSLPTVLGAVSRFKEENPGRMLVLGGPGASDLPQLILTKFPVDVVVIGEGEETVVEFLAALEGGQDLSRVRGIAYRASGRVVTTRCRPRIRHLDRLPFPAYHKINFQDYRPPVAPVAVSRGCPYQCTFCSAHSTWGEGVTFRSSERVLEEIALVRHSVPEILFVDDVFPVGAPLLGKLRAVGRQLRWSCNMRVGEGDPALWQHMRESGCVGVLFGIESGSDRVLRTLRKGFRVAQARAEVTAAARYISDVTTSYIWGFPFETLDDFFETLLSLCQDSRLPGVCSQIGQLAPLPRSALYAENRHLVSFAPDLVSPVVFPPPDSLSNYPELVNLIRSCPQLFAPFYYFAHGRFGPKKAIIDQLVGRSKHD